VRVASGVLIAGTAAAVVGCAPATERPITSATAAVASNALPRPLTPLIHQAPRSSYLRFAAEQPSECWQADFTHYPLASGTGTGILTWLDDHSRTWNTCTGCSGKRQPGFPRRWNWPRTWWAGNGSHLRCCDISAPTPSDR
jgi:hypothetical protein